HPGAPPCHAGAWSGPDALDFGASASLDCHGDVDAPRSPASGVDGGAPGRRKSPDSDAGTSVTRPPPPKSVTTRRACHGKTPDVGGPTPACPHGAPVDCDRARR